MRVVRRLRLARRIPCSDLWPDFQFRQLDGSPALGLSDEHHGVAVQFDLPQVSCAPNLEALGQLQVLVVDQDVECLAVILIAEG